MQNRQPDMENLLAARFSGNLPEDGSVQEWIKNNPAEYRELENAWNAAERDFFIEDPDSSEAWKKVAGRIEIPVEHNQVRYKWLAVAASLILIAMISFFLIRTSSQDTYAMMNQTGTMSGEQKSVVLPDGTKVKLNSSSVLRYPTEFNDLNREVYLEGEAYFEVTKDQEHPFVIHGNQAEVKVLGTEFNVRAYPEAASMQVAVRNGKVAMIPKDPGKREILFLHDMKKGISTVQDDVWTIEDADESDFAWVDGKLVFNELPLKEVVERINLMYNSNIIVDSNVQQCRVSCSFEQKDITQVLKTLSLMLQLDVQKSGGQVRLSGRGC